MLSLDKIIKKNKDAYSKIQHGGQSRTTDEKNPTLYENIAIP